MARKEKGTTKIREKDDDAQTMKNSIRKSSSPRQHTIDAAAVSVLGSDTLLSPQFFLKIDDALSSGGSYDRTKKIKWPAESSSSRKKLESGLGSLFMNSEIEEHHSSSADNHDESKRLVKEDDDNDGDKSGYESSSDESFHLPVTRSTKPSRKKRPKLVQVEDKPTKFKSPNKASSSYGQKIISSSTKRGLKTRQRTIAESANYTKVRIATEF